MVLIADIGGTNCRFELWDIDLQDRTQHRELFHIVRRPQFLALPGRRLIGSGETCSSMCWLVCKLANKQMGLLAGMDTVAEPLRFAPLNLKTRKYLCVTQTYPTREFPTFPEALQALARQPAFEAHTPRAAAFGVAGPVADNRCQMTNLNWVIDGDYLTTTYGVRCGRPHRMQAPCDSSDACPGMRASSASCSAAFV